MTKKNLILLLIFSVLVCSFSVYTKYIKNYAPAGIGKVNISATQKVSPPTLSLSETIAFLEQLEETKIAAALKEVSGDKNATVLRQLKTKNTMATLGLALSVLLFLLVLWKLLKAQ